jgi:hypothetical protein
MPAGLPAFRHLDLLLTFAAQDGQTLKTVLHRKSKLAGGTDKLNGHGGIPLGMQLDVP